MVRQVSPARRRSFLASLEASYVTGAGLLVDGGLVAMSVDGGASYEFSS